MKRKPILYGFTVLLAAAPLPAQGLFEAAVSGNDAPSANDRQPGMDIGGYVRGAVFAGDDQSGTTRITSADARLSLKLTADKNDLGKAHAELWFDADALDRETTVRPDLREAWIAAYPGLFDIRLGKQIIAWGRADGLNPTNNVTPMNSLARSSELDDTRLGNLLARCRFNLAHASLEGIWIPVFAPDELLIDESMMPAGIVMGDPAYPDNALDNGGYALRLDLSFPRMDGSVSYFNGHETQPGFGYEPGAATMTLLPTAYRIQAVGADFSTALASFGLRGEIGAELPAGDYENDAYVPNPSLQAVLGVDKTVGNVNLLLQYSARYVADFTALTEPVLTDTGMQARMIYAAESAAMEIENFNRLFAGNADETSHALTARAGWDLLYETLHLELAAMYNVTTGEYAVNPKVSYDISDAFTAVFGARYLDGPAGSLNDLVGTAMNYGFTELKLSF